MDVAVILTIIFGLVSVVAFLFALRESRKAKSAELRIKEIEQAVVSYKYLKDKALAAYGNGKYEESLDILKKYLLDNKDEKEWVGLMVDIFKTENRKLFADSINQAGVTPVSCILFYMLNYDKFQETSRYPDLLKSLLEMYRVAFNKVITTPALLIALLDRDWKKCLSLLPSYSPFSDDGMNESWRELISKFCASVSPTPEFQDDIPF